ncbi:histidine kinase [Actinoplanes sp. NPDC049548]|uniref:histidine kinase n=1 Tax=Actinoplanes sp. NPDC049548 TaxID=3155152 RepID=UPI00342E28DB
MHRWLVRAAGMLIAVAVPLTWLVLVLLAGPSDGTATRPATYPASHWGRGVLVTSVFAPDSGLEAQDVVTAVNGVPIDEAVSGAVRRTGWRVGDHVTYTVQRAGRELRVDVTLTEYPLLDAARKAWPILVFEVLMFALGAFVMLSRPADWAARVLFLLAVMVPVGFTAWPFSMQVSDLIGGRGLWPQVLGSVAWTLVWVLLAHFALLFPEPPPRRRARWATAGVYLMPLMLYLGYLALTVPRADTTLERWERVLSVSAPTQLVAPLVILTLIIWAYRRTSEPAAKQRVRWVLGTLLLALGASILLNQLPSALIGRSLLWWPMEPLLFLLVALTIVAGILRYRLFDIQVILKRSLVYGGLTTLLLGMYLLTAVLVNRVVPEPPTIVALAVGATVALCFHPLRVRLSRSLGQLVFGQRDNPFEVVSRLAGLEVDRVPQQVLTALVETLAQALRLPFAQIELRTPDGTLLRRVAYGHPQGVPVMVSLTGLPEVDGRLMLDPGPGREPFGPADSQLLQALAVHAGAVVHTALLAEELQQVRERLVAAREEERRRLQRDLHDGVGPTLASAAMQADAALEILDRDQGHDEALTSVRLVAEQTKMALADIRRIVHRLRPPALDQLGLVDTLRERAASFRLSSDSTHPRGFEAVVVAKDELRGLPAAVEMAAFSIVLEGVNNAARHADASRCEVYLWRDAALHVEIHDNGRGIAAGSGAGLGLISMQERAAELGGECVIETEGGRGTLIRARLPLTERAEAPR